MKMLVCAIRDQATASFGNPMIFVNHGQAIRSFADEVNRDDPQNMLHKHASDFELYELGEYDNESALFSCGNPKQLVTAKSVLAPK